MTTSTSQTSSSRKPPALGLHGREGAVRWLFTHRHGGVSVDPFGTLNLGDRVGDDPDRVAANRALVACRGIGVDPSALVVMRACHGSRVEVVADAGPLADEFDGLVTAMPGTALAATAADCMPVLLYDAHSGIVGAVHSGWMGLRDGVSVRAVDVMRGLGATRLTAVVGPSICGRCYGVPAERFDEVVTLVPEAASTTANGGPSLDLRAGVSAQLARADVRVEHVRVCTAESPDHFSFRRDGVTGRQAGVIVVDPGPVERGEEQPGG